MTLHSSHKKNISTRTTKLLAAALLCSSVGAVLLPTSACTTTSGAEGKSNVITKMTLAMPSTWDDRFLEQMSDDKEPPKPVIAVLPFEINDALKGKVDVKVADMLTTSLFKTSRFELVERERIDAVLKEQSLKMSGLIDDASKAAEVGKLLGAEAVIFGTLSNATQQTTDKFSYDLVETNVRLDARAINTTTGKIVFSEGAAGSTESKIVRAADGTLIRGAIDHSAEFAKATEKATGSLGKAIGALYPTMGVVINFEPSDNTAILSVGAAQGLSVGDSLIIFRPVEKLINPVNGKSLGWKKQLLYLVEVQSAEQATSTVVLRGKGSDSDVALLPPQVGDFAVVVSRPKTPL